MHHEHAWLLLAAVAGRDDDLVETKVVSSQPLVAGAEMETE